MNINDAYHLLVDMTLKFVNDKEYYKGKYQGKSSRDLLNIRRRSHDHVERVAIREILEARRQK